MQIGEYRVLRRLAQTSIAQSFEVVHTATHERYFLKAALHADPRRTAGLLSELTHLSGIAHPALPRLVHIGLGGATDSLAVDTPYFVAAWQPGQSLRTQFLSGQASALAPARPTSDVIAVVLAVLVDGAAALAALHAAGVVHRDVAPQNLLWDGAQLSLVDLGFAAPRHTEEVAGTPGYLAPEALFGAYDERSDLYSLGLCAVAVLAGHDPFTAASIGELLIAKQRGVAEAALATAPQALRPLLSQLVAPDPRARPASAHEVEAEARILADVLGYPQRQRPQVPHADVELHARCRRATEALLTEALSGARTEQHRVSATAAPEELRSAHHLLTELLLAPAARIAVVAPQHAGAERIVARAARAASVSGLSAAAPPFELTYLDVARVNNTAAAASLATATTHRPLSPTRTAHADSGAARTVDAKPARAIELVQSYGHPDALRLATTLSAAPLVANHLVLLCEAPPLESTWVVVTLEPLAANALHAWCTQVVGSAPPPSWLTAFAEVTGGWPALATVALAALGATPYATMPHEPTNEQQRTEVSAFVRRAAPEAARILALAAAYAPAPIAAVRDLAHCGVAAINSAIAELGAKHLRWQGEAIGVSAAVAAVACAADSPFATVARELLATTPLEAPHARARLWLMCTPDARDAAACMQLAQALVSEHAAPALARALAEPFVHDAGARVSPQQRAHAACIAAQSAIAQSHYPAAVALAQHALAELPQQAGLLSAQAQRRMGKPQAALAQLTAIIAAHGATADLRGEQGRIHIALGQYQLATQAVASFAATNPRCAEAAALAHYYVGETAQAQQHAHTALAQWAAVRDTHGVARARAILAMLEQHDGHLADAAQHYAEAAQAARRAGDSHTAATCDANGGSVRADRGLYGTALGNYTSAAAVFTALQAMAERDAADANRAFVLLGMLQFAAAERVLRDLQERPNLAPHLARYALVYRGDAAWGQGDDDAARAHYHAAAVAAEAAADQRVALAALAAQLDRWPTTDAVSPLLLTAALANDAESARATLAVGRALIHGAALTSEQAKALHAQLIEVLARCESEGRHERSFRTAVLLAQLQWQCDAGGAALTATPLEPSATLAAHHTAHPDARIVSDAALTTPHAARAAQESAVPAKRTVAAYCAVAMRALQAVLDDLPPTLRPTWQTDRDVQDLQQLQQMLHAVPAAGPAQAATRNARHTVGPNRAVAPMTAPTDAATRATGYAAYSPVATPPAAPGALDTTTGFAAHVGREPRATIPGALTAVAAAALPSAQLDPRTAEALGLNSAAPPPDNTLIEVSWLRRLLVLGRRLASEPQMARILDEIIETAIEITNAERALILLQQGTEFTVAAARGFGATRDPAHDFSTQIANKAAREGVPVLTVDAGTDTRFDANHSIAALRLRSVVAVPLWFRSQSIGCLYVDHRIRQGAFEQADIGRLRDLADLAASALANAQLTATLSAQRAEIASLNAQLAEELALRETELVTTRHALAHAAANAPLLHSTRNDNFAELVGNAPAFCTAIATLERACTSLLPAVIVGESGTGKELVARALHFHGPRANGPFVAVNCGALAEPLLESELFGHVRGAFTGALRDRPGLFERADGGTLFLDEITDTSPAMQTKLLRVLQDGEVRRLGSETSRHVSVRVIAATQLPLAELVATGRFREDLRYRLDVLTIALPPLRDRVSDILPLAHMFAARLRKKPTTFAPAVERALLAHSWPGNIRELENAVARAIALGDDVLSLEDFPELARAASQLSEGTSHPTRSTALELHEATRHEGELDLRTAVDTLETQYIRTALQRARGNHSAAAKLLGLSRFGLQKKMQRLGLTRTSDVEQMPPKPQ